MLRIKAQMLITLLLQLALVNQIWIVSGDLDEFEQSRMKTQKEIEDRIQEARDRIARIQEEAQRSVEDSLKRTQESFPDLNLNHEERMKNHEEYMRNLRERLDREREQDQNDQWREEAQKRIQELRERAKRDGFDPDNPNFPERKFENRGYGRYMDRDDIYSAPDITSDDSSRFNEREDIQKLSRSQNMDLDNNFNPESGQEMPDFPGNWKQRAKFPNIEGNDFPGQEQREEMRKRHMEEMEKLRSSYPERPDTEWFEKQRKLREESFAKEREERRKKFQDDGLTWEQRIEKMREEMKAQRNIDL